MATQVNSIELTILYILQTISAEANPDGAMSIVQTQTPTAHQRLTSLDDFRLMMRMMSGILKNGNIIAVTSAICCCIFPLKSCN